MIYDGSDYYVSAVTVAVNIDNIEFSVSFSKNFNRLSQYIGINSQWRSYEISDRIAYKRNIVYRDFCLISFNDNLKSSNHLLSQVGIRAIQNTFYQQVSGMMIISSPLTRAAVTPLDAAK